MQARVLLWSLLLAALPQVVSAQETIWGSTAYEALHIKCTVPAVGVRPKINAEIKTFLNHYRAEFIQERLRKIVVCGALSRWDHSFYRGTYDLADRAIFVEVGDGKLNDTEYILHHELSSIVWHTKADIFFKHSWTRHSNFRYEVDSNISSDWTPRPKYQRNGALFRYCKTTPENDFNVVAAFLIADYLRPHVEKAEKRYSRIRAKAELVRKIYAGILKDPI